MKIDRTVRVELTHEDIEQAIRNYVAEQVPGISDCVLDIYDGNAPLVAGRDNAHVPLTNLHATAEIELAPQPVYRPLKAGDNAKGTTWVIDDDGERNPLPPFKRQFSDAVAQRSDNLD